MPTHFGPVIASRDGLTVIDCRECGWAHLDPLPAIPDGYYESEFWQKTKAGWRQKHEAEIDWLNMRYNDWLTLCHDYSEGTAGRLLLDVGSGWGFFLAAAKRRLWGIVGIEPSIEAADYSSKHGAAPVLCGTWEDYDSEEHINSFDCISALWLMEHLVSPQAFLAWCRAHLAPGGVLLLAVPQEWNQEQKIANATAAVKNWWVHPTHLNYWSAPTFYGMLGRAGFKVVDALTTYPIEVHIQTGADYTANEWVGDALHSGVRKSELAMTREQRLDMQRTTARVCIGRDLVVVCK